MLIKFCGWCSLCWNILVITAYGATYTYVAAQACALDLVTNSILNNENGRQLPKIVDDKLRISYETTSLVSGNPTVSSVEKFSHTCN